MDSRHFISLSVIVLSVFIAVVSCAPPEPPLRVGCNPWPGYLALYYARDLHIFNEREIRLIDFDSTEDTLRAFRNDAIDAAAVTLDEALHLAERGDALHIVLVFDTSNGADALLAHPPIKRLQDLRGQRIGVETNALGAYMLSRALERGNLQLKDVHIVDLPLQEQAQAFEKHAVDAVITFEPLRSRLLAAGAREIFSSRDIPGEIVDVLVVRDTVLERRPKQLRRLIDSYFEGLQRLHEAPDIAATQLGQRTGSSSKALLAAWQLMTLTDRSANRQLFEDPNGLRATMQRLARIMTDSGLLTRKAATETLLDGRLLQEPRR